MIDVNRSAGGDAVDRVRVWYFSLDLEPRDHAFYERILNDEEMRRAERFRFAEHRRRFVVGRSTLRMILGYYARCTPESVRLAYGEYGKPSFAGPGSGEGLRFSVSNSGDIGVVAVAFHMELGVDIEQVRPGRDHDLIVSREFSEDEKRWYMSLPTAEREAAFFDLWTCKEAYLKGKGTGLGAGLNRFSVSLREGAAPQLIWSDIEVGDPQRWYFHRLELAPGCAACLAVEAECRAVDAAPWWTAG